MAAITASNVTVFRSWESPAIDGGMREVVKDVLVVLAAQGGTAGDIPASALGFSRMNWCVPQTQDVAGVPKWFAAGVDKTGAEVVPFDVTQATDANRNLRANLTGNFYLRVAGIPKR